MRYYSGYYQPNNVEAGVQNESVYLQVNCAGYFEFDRTYHVATHRKKGRKDYLLVYVHSGKALVRSGCTDHEINAGTVFLYRPSEEQYYGQIKNEPAECYWAHFTGFSAQDILQKTDFGKDNIFITGVSDGVCAIFKMMINELLEKPDNYSFMTASLLVQVICLLSRMKLSNGRIEKVREREQKINFTLSYIHSNYSRKITLAELARICNLCRNRYIVVFKEHLGMTPFEYLMNYRLQKARELLDNTDLSVRQVSVLTGFEDQLYFSRVFKRHVGASPEKYRAGAHMSGSEHANNPCNIPANNV